MRSWSAVFVLIAASAWAAGPARDSGPASQNRFPQPVRAGDLIGRKLIGPTEAQPLLGRVTGVAQGPDGAPALRIRTASLLPWGGRVIEVPVASVALLGELVALMDLTPAQLAARPQAQDAAPVPPDAMIPVGLVRPFH